jgi:hypothetical protein
VTVLSASVVVLTTAPLSSINEFIQWSANATAISVKKVPTYTASNESLEAKRLGVYRPPVPKYKRLKDLPLPLQVIEQYKRWHSVDSLIRNETNGRKYSLAFYQCPLTAGNRMHHFFNDFLWAILSNRTMLWKYYDRETCLKYGRHYSKQICDDANTANDCGEILLRAPWIPSYDEWAPKLNLSEPFEVPFHSTHPRYVNNERFPRSKQDRFLFGVDDAEKYPQQVAAFQQNRWKLWALEEEKHQNYLLETQRGRNCAKKLYSLGTYFLFGLLHRSAFDLSIPIRTSEATSLDNKNAVSVAIHSRHIYKEVDGCNVTRETNCMRTIIQNAHGSSVNVRLMSDRTCTISRMKSWLSKRNVSVATVEQHVANKDMFVEHGPFPGTGFYQDLALASTARSAVVAMDRSSSDLMTELVVFNRKMDAWRSGENVTAANVEICFMEKEVNPLIPVVHTTT